MTKLSDAAEYCTQGSSRHARGDLDGALAEFTRALDIDPAYAVAWNNRGATRHALGDLAGARLDFDQALEREPRYAEAYNNRGIVRHATGDFMGARGDFDQALSLQPENVATHSNRAVTRLVLEDYAGAISDFDQVIRAHPSAAEAYHGRAAARRGLWDLSGAAADYGRVLGLVPRERAAPVYHLRGAIFFCQRRFADAVADFNEALAIDPNLCMVYISRGNARYHLRDLGALADYQFAFKLDAQATAAEIIRTVRADLEEDTAAAFENCRKHVRICPEDLIAYVRRGLMLCLLGRVLEAAQDFDKSLSLSSASGVREHIKLLRSTAHRARVSGTASIEP